MSCRVLLLLVSCLACALAQAQGFPKQPIRIIIGLGAGGVADGMTRTITERMTPALGQPFVLENRPGAGGNIAMEAVVKAPADGHTLLLIGPALVINPALYARLAFDPLKDLAPVSPIALAPFALFTSGTLPVSNVAELVALARAKPGSLNYATVGAGTAGHLAAVLFSSTAGLQVTHVPYRSIQLAIPDLVSGQMHFVFNAYPPLAPMLQGGRLKLMGVSSARRLKQLAEIPTLAETGLPGFEATGWYAVLAPAATPREVLTRLNAEFARALRQAEVAQAVEKMGFDPAPMSLQETERWVSSEADQWARAVKLSGAKVE